MGGNWRKPTQTKEIPGIKIFQSSTTIYFANAELYEKALRQMSGINVTRLISKKKKRITKLKQQLKKQEKQEKKKAKKEKKIRKGLESGSGDIAVISGNPDNSISLEMDLSHGSSSKVDKKPEEQDLEALGLQKPEVHSIILDLSPVNFVDTVCIKIMRNIFRDFKDIEVDVYLAGCHWAIVQQFEQGEFFGKNISKSQLFPTVHDAVTHCLMKQNPTTDQALCMNGHLSLPPSQEQEPSSDSGISTKF